MAGIEETDWRAFTLKEAISILAAGMGIDP